MGTYKSAAPYETYETKREGVRISADSKEFFVILAERYGFIVELSCRLDKGGAGSELSYRSAADLLSDREMRCIPGEDSRGSHPVGPIQRHHAESLCSPAQFSERDT